MNTRQFLLIVLGCVLLFSSCVKQNDIPAPDIDWKYQVDSLLMPFWMTEEAQGSPIGNFPTYRASDGSVMTKNTIDYKRLSDIDNLLFLGGTDSLQREFLRMKSRQVYGYGVAYHLTGNEAYLKLAKAGTDYLLKNGEYSSGIPTSFWKNGTAMPGVNQRNAQDLAYSLTGPVFYYYLTRDKEVLSAILKVKDYIFDHYYQPMPNDENRKHFIWVKEDFEYDTKNRIELVAQLDQLNAYMLLLSRLLPEEERQQFNEEMKAICYFMKDKFYNEEFNLFSGNLNADLFDSSHSDFGHTIKTFWMMLKVGHLVGDENLIAFAESNATKLLDAAFVERTGGWAWKYVNNTGERDEGNLWWVFTELDQMAATLSLADTTFYATYLKRSYKYWESNFIDKKNKEVWMALYDDGRAVTELGKAGIYKNAYHSLEHALVGYLSTANYYNQDIKLYYAFKQNVKLNDISIHPYYYNAEINATTEFDLKDKSMNELQGVEVVYKKIK